MTEAIKAIVAILLSAAVLFVGLILTGNQIGFFKCLLIETVSLVLVGLVLAGAFE